MGTHDVPPLSERHTPPCAVPTNTMSGLVGWTAIAVTRPVTAVVTVVVCPFGIGHGPIGDQKPAAANGASALVWRSSSRAARTRAWMSGSPGAPP